MVKESITLAQILKLILASNETPTFISYKYCKCSLACKLKINYIFENNRNPNYENNHSQL